MRAVVTKVIDHWTVECIIYLPLNIQVIRPVRLYGLRPTDVDACKEALFFLVDRQDVTINVREDKTGKYGQLLGTLFQDGENVNKFLIGENYAKVFSTSPTKEV